MATTGIAFSAYGISVHWYGIFIATAVMFGVIVASKREIKLGLPKETTLDFIFYAVPLALIFARLYYVAFTWNVFSANPISALYIWQGGLAIYGAIIGGVIAALIFSKVKKIPFMTLADLAIPSLVLGQAIGRWGNFANQEAYGELVTNAAHQFFPMAVYIQAVSEWHYATFFYESMWCFGVFAALLVLDKYKRRMGDLLYWYLLLYSPERFLVEGMRTDSLMLGSIRVSQALSFVMMASSLLVFAYRASKLKAVVISCGVLIAGILIIMASQNIVNAELKFIVQVIGTLIIPLTGTYWYFKTKE